MDSETGTTERIQVSKQLVDTVRKYVEIDNSIKQLKDEIKKFTDSKKKCQEFILEYLSTSEEQQIEITDGLLKRDVKKTQAPLKKETIQSTLTRIVGDNVKASQMVEEIYKARPTIEKVSLRRIKPKKT